MHKVISGILAVIMAIGLCVGITACGTTEEETVEFESWVYDNSDTLSSGTINYIDQQNETLYNDCGNRIMVAVIPKDGDDTIFKDSFCYYEEGDGDFLKDFLILLYPDTGVCTLTYGCGWDGEYGYRFTEERAENYLDEYFYSKLVGEDKQNYDVAVTSLVSALISWVEDNNNAQTEQ